jgi:lysophospholipase L1-like esterase
MTRKTILSRQNGYLSGPIPGIPGTAVPGTGIVPNDFALEWRRLYAQRNLKLVKVLCIGDSVTTGGGATSTGGMAALWWRYVYALQRQLNDGYGWDTATLADNYGMGNAFVRTAWSNGWVQAGVPVLVARGSGAQSLSLPVGASTAMNFGDVKTLLWAYETGVGSHPIHVKVQAGTVTTPIGSPLIDTDQAVNTGLPQYTRQETGFEVTTRGPHFIQFTRPAGNTGDPVIDWVKVITGNQNIGVQVLDWGWNGSHSGTFAGTGAQAASARLAITGQITPQMMIIFLGTNDFIGNISAATYKTQMQDIITRYRALSGLSKMPILLVDYFARYDHPSPSPADLWAQYRVVLQQLINENGRMGYIDLAPYFSANQTADDADMDLIDTSGVHPTNAGHNLIAQALADVLKKPFNFA